MISTQIAEQANMPYREELESFIRNDQLMDKIAEVEIKSTKTNREESFYVCGDRLIKLVGVKTSDKAVVFDTPRVVANACGSVPPISVHFHGPYPSHQSPTDKMTHKRLFNNGFSMGCSFGIDGGRCLVPTGKEYNIPYTDKFYEEAKKHGVVIVPDVKSVMCVRSEKKRDHECIIRTKDGGPVYDGVFSEQVFEQESSVSPHIWLTEKDSVPFIEKASGSRSTMCAISETEIPKLSERVKNSFMNWSVLKSRGEKFRKKRILTCFFRDRK